MLPKEFPPAPFSSPAPPFITAESLPALVEQCREAGRESAVSFGAREIGMSREGRPLTGLRVGHGPASVSLVAGAHADEPVGPMTIMALALWLCEGSEEACRLAEQFTFFMVPHVNPDGAAANAPWCFYPLDPVEYAKHVVREAPGDDVEFGYPAGDVPALRPENAAVAAFLQSEGPFVYHASLHGMAFAEGAWFLIGKERAPETRELQQHLAYAAAEEGFPLRDVDRQGEKGFYRIATGFATTPTSTAMKQHFRDQKDAETAERFHPSSMEMVESFGGKPLVMVSELPLFSFTPQALHSNPNAYEELRAALPKARGKAAAGDDTELRELVRRFGLYATPFTVQIRLQAKMVLLGAQWAAQHR